MTIEVFRHLLMPGIMRPEFQTNNITLVVQCSIYLEQGFNVVVNGDTSYSSMFGSDLCGLMLVKSVLVDNREREYGIVLTDWDILPHPHCRFKDLTGKKLKDWEREYIDNPDDVEPAWYDSIPAEFPVPIPKRHLSHYVNFCAGL
ncbi:hypothetical protein MKW98_020957 [Papaver atlanticum]|uniref:Uncharacterized protein n=1 Tax=Papaver atlanticum TaxID=357466 RepID=A0AAD4TCW6_9MAGN|nr:hypothetical protein MKW98_020957 [Papaver atlanticum]